MGLVTAVTILCLGHGSAQADPVSDARALLKANKPEKAMAALDAAEFGPKSSAYYYWNARVKVAVREAKPCTVMFEEALDTVVTSARKSAKARKKIQREGHFTAYRSTCQYLTSVDRISTKSLKGLRKILEGVEWHGTDWGKNAPGPQDSVSFAGGKVFLSAQGICGGGTVKGSYKVKDGKLLINGTCSRGPKLLEAIKLKLTFDPQTCTIKQGKKHLFGDAPDECNT